MAVSHALSSICVRFAHNDAFELSCLRHAFRNSQYTEYLNVLDIKNAQ